MRSFLLVLLLLVSSVASAQIMEQHAQNDMGQPFIRLYNNTPYYASCFYKDAYNYLTFVIAPGTVSLWYPVYGYYVWQCN